MSAVKHDTKKVRLRKGRGLSLEDARIGWRFFSNLRSFLRTPLTLDQAARRVALRRMAREASLLGVLDRFCAEPRTPYGKLLRACGIESGDAARLLRENGVDGALTQLFRAGVYLRNDEFKGRVPVRRGSLSFTVDPTELLNPRATVHGLTQSSGSRGKPTPVPIDLAFIEDHAINTLLALHAYGGDRWVHAHYGVPGGTSITNPLELAKGGHPPARWFTPILPTDAQLHPRYAWSARALWLGSRLAGVPMPGPTLAPQDDLTAVVQWLRDVLDRGEIPHLWTVASMAVLICRAAAGQGTDIAGTRFTAGGEPNTKARRSEVETSGAVMIPRMGATETDILSYACLDAQSADDMHFFDDRHALIQPGPGSESGLPPQSMLLTSLLPSAPLWLLNVSMGDQACVVRRNCACPLDDMGWQIHISEVRSFEKLTAAGLTFLDFDVIRVLEEALPARFGGSSLDYQLVERADRPSGRGQIQLRVHPAVGELDSDAVLDAFLNGLGGGTGGEKLMELQWRERRVVEIVRQAPEKTTSGKILHLFQKSATHTGSLRLTEAK